MAAGKSDDRIRRQSVGSAAFLLNPVFPLTQFPGSQDLVALVLQHRLTAVAPALPGVVLIANFESQHPHYIPLTIPVTQKLDGV